MLALHSLQPILMTSSHRSKEALAVTCDSHVFWKRPEHTQFDINNLRASKIFQILPHNNNTTTNLQYLFANNMKSTLKNVANECKRACPECHRRKIRCPHSVTESQQMLSKEVTTEEELDNHTTTEDNFTAMERDRDYDYKTNKSSAAKRVRKGPQCQQPLPSAAGPSSAGPSSSSTPSAAPVQAVFAGTLTTVPSPEDPVNMYDVEEFLLHFEVVVRALPSSSPLF
jgi:hypothetical protein